MMRLSIALLLAGAAGGRALEPPQPVDLQADRTAILAIHATDREAHFKTDPDLLFSNTGTGFLSVSRGHVGRPRIEDLKATFRDVFKGAIYQEWDDVEPPVVRISNDGTMAWMIARVRVRRLKADASGREQTEQFTYAGIITYEKRAGRWVKTANVSTVE